MSIDLSLLVAFATFAIVASVTPGPNNLMVMASGAAFGFRRTVPHVLGIVGGFSIMLGSVSFGLGAVIEAYPLALDLVRYAGGLWMLWLAWQFLSPVLFPKPAAPGARETVPGSRPLRLYEAAMFQWINPKSWTIAVATAGAYSGLTDTPVGSTLVMLAVFLAVAPLSNFLWVMAGQSVRKLMAEGRSARFFSAGMGILIALTAVSIMY